MINVLLLCIWGAQASPLSAGYKGQPFGATAIATTPPGPECVHSAPTERVLHAKWTCPGTIGSQAATVFYQVAGSVFWGVQFQVDDCSTQDASELHAFIVANYGIGHVVDDGKASSMVTVGWKDGTNMAVFAYMAKYEMCMFSIFDAAQQSTASKAEGAL